MDDLRFCPACGKARDADSAFCAGCGRSYAPATPIGRRPRAARRFFAAMGALVVMVLAGALLMLVVSAVVPGGQSPSRSFAALAAVVTGPTATPTPVPTPTPMPLISCRQAGQLVFDRHSTLFGLMMGSMHLSFECAETADVSGLQDVRVSWTYQSVRHAATYAVSLQGVVTAADPNAVRLDEVAKYGPLALKMLAF